MTDFDVYIHDTYKLLRIYRKCVWSLSESVDDIRDKMYETFKGTLFSSESKKNILSLVKAIETCDIDVLDTNIEERLKSFYKSARLIEFADSALIKLKSFPICGEKYYHLLYETYFSTDKLAPPKTVDIMIKLGYAELKTFYSNRKHAVRLFNSILWDSYEGELYELRPYIENKLKMYGWTDNPKLINKS